jgi:Tfp pilus assembly protein PilO
LSPSQPQVIGIRKLPVEQRFLMHGVIACALAAAAYYFVVRPEKVNLSAAQSALASQENDLRTTASLPHVVDDLPAAITDMVVRRDKLLARLKDSNDVSSLYDKIGKLAQRCGVRTDRIDPMRSENRSVSSAPKLNSKNRMTLESFGFQIEMVGTYESVAKFIDAINVETGVTMIVGMTLEPLDVIEGKPIQVRGTLTTLHYKMASRKESMTGAPSTGGSR